MSRLRRSFHSKLAAIASASVAVCGLGLPSASAGGPLLGVSIGGEPVVSLGGSSAAGTAEKPTLGVSVLNPSSPPGAPALVEASVGERKVLSVPTPALPATPNPPVPNTGGGTPIPGGGASGGPVPVPPIGSIPPKSGGSSSPPAVSAPVSSPPSSSGSVASAAGTSPASTESAATTAGKGGKGAPSQSGRRSQRPGSGAGSGTGTPVGAGATPSGGPTTGTTRTASRKTSSRAARHRTSGGRGPLNAIGRQLPLPLPVPDWSKPIILLLLLLSLALAVRSRAAVRRTRRLQRQQSSLLEDIDAMQAALVPALSPELADEGVSVAYRPAEGPAAGGDFYDVFELDQDRIGIILGDVAGHGHESIQQAALVRYTLRAFMHTAAQPRAALALAGQALSEPDCDQLATVAAAIFDPHKGTLTYALAGHPAPILLGADIAEAPTSCSSPPLGWNLPTGRRQRTVSLHAGVRACFFSDGLVEARCDELQDTERPALLGRERLDEILRRLEDADSAPQLLRAVRAEATATPDDMAACIIAPRVPADGRAVDIEELEFDLATIEGGHLQRFLDACGLSQDRVRELIVHARAELALAPTALTLVDRCGRGATPVVTARIATAPPAAGERQPPPGREPLEV